MLRKVGQNVNEENKINVDSFINELYAEKKEASEVRILSEAELRGKAAVEALPVSTPSPTPAAVALEDASAVAGLKTEAGMQN